MALWGGHRTFRRWSLIKKKYVIGEWGRQTLKVCSLTPTSYSRSVCYVWGKMLSPSPWRFLPLLTRHAFPLTTELPAPAHVPCFLPNDGASCSCSHAMVSPLRRSFLLLLTHHVFPITAHTPCFPHHDGLYPLELLAKTNSPFLKLPLVMVFYRRESTNRDK